jgi:hypothetical protein
LPIEGERISAAAMRPGGSFRQDLRVALASREASLVNRDAELRGDGVDVAHVQMDEAAGRRVAVVLGQVEADVAARDGNEPREAGLKLVLPLLAKPEPLVR